MSPTSHLLKASKTHRARTCTASTRWKQVPKDAPQAEAKKGYSYAWCQGGLPTGLPTHTGPQETDQNEEPECTAQMRIRGGHGNRKIKDTSKDDTKIKRQRWRYLKNPIYMKNT